MNDWLDFINAGNARFGITDTNNNYSLNANKSIWDSSSFGWNPGTIGLALEGLNALGSLYTGFKGLSLAKDQFGFQKNLANVNLANSVQAYNTALADRAKARAVMETGNASNADEYIKLNSLSNVRL